MAGHCSDFDLSPDFERPSAVRVKSAAFWFASDQLVAQRGLEHGWEGDDGTTIPRDAFAGEVLCGQQLILAPDSGAGFFVAQRTSQRDADA